MRLDALIFNLIEWRNKVSTLRGELAGETIGILTQKRHVLVLPPGMCAKRCTVMQRYVFLSNGAARCLFGWLAVKKL